MNKEELIQYWENISDRDYETMLNLFKSGDYHWSLFVGHLVIEKLIKALYIKNNEFAVNPPKTHDLALLAEKAGIQIDEITHDSLDRITTFNINASYPDYKQDFYKKCTMKFT
jgi:HEPN domain-containing protein